LPGGGLLDVPVGIRDGFGFEGREDSTIFWYQTIHRKPIVSGFVARMSPVLRARYHDSPVMQALLDLSAAKEPSVAIDPHAGAVELATTWKVRYIVVEVNAVSPATQRFIEAMQAPLIDQDQFHRIYQLPAPSD
jgi:hypothetical protein